MECCPPPAADADSWTLANRAAELNELCRFEEAAALCLAATAQDPRCWSAWNNLGNAMTELQRYDDAVAAYSNALAINPGAARAAANMGVALFRRGAPGPAVAFLEIAAEMEPENAETRCNLAQSLLAAGDWERGFAEYEWRWRTAAMAGVVETAPRWQGEPFAGRTLLITEEGGFGDTLQFVRYAPLAKSRGGMVILQARAPLAALLARMPGIDAIVPTGAPPPPHDLQAPLLTLPHLFATTTDTVPLAGGYLTPDPMRVAAWRERLARHGTAARLNVGLVWAGAPRPGMRGAALADHRRSMRLGDLQPLAALSPEVAFHSLQVGAAGAAARQPPQGMVLHDDTAAIGDWDDTAALVSLLDLVVAVDTSTAHLAAALGKPVFLLSRYDQCWRWLADRTDTPWYRSMRIFRQTRPLDWDEAVRAVARDVGLCPTPRQDKRSWTCQLKEVQGTSSLAGFGDAPRSSQGVGVNSVDPV